MSAAEDLRDTLANALNVALAANARGDSVMADRALKLAQAIAPTHSDVLHVRGLIAHARAALPAARALVAAAAQAAPDVSVYWNNLSLIERELGHHADAEAAARRAIALRADYAQAWNNLGVTLVARDAYGEAADAFGRAIELDPAPTDWWLNWSLALSRCGRAGDALRAAKEVHRRMPQGSDGLGAISAALSAGGERGKAANALGLALMASERFAEAVDALDEAVRLMPEVCEHWHNLGFAREQVGDQAGAIAAFDRALALDPGNRDTLTNRAMTHLARHDFERGWADYRRRRKGSGKPGDTPPPEFAADLAGQTIRIVRDQGVGDDLFFLRFAPELERRGACVVADMDPRINAMVARIGFACGEAGNDALRSSDLPFRLGHRAASDCPPSLRLAPLDARLARLRDWMEAQGPAPRIALTWRAGVEVAGRHTKLTPFDALAAAMASVPGTIIAVQRRPLAGEIDRLRAVVGPRVVDACEINDDLEDMLALMALVDRYVAVSNTNLHLRAACGLTTHVLVPFPGEWRWQPDGDGVVPWFRDHPTYRQAPDGDWSAALRALAGDLAAGVSAR